MATDLRATELSDLHMLVLGRIAHHAAADAQDIAGWLGVPVAVAEALCAGAGSRGPCHARRRPLTSCGQVVDEGSTATATSRTSGETIDLGRCYWTGFVALGRHPAASSSSSSRRSAARLRRDVQHQMIYLVAGPQLVSGRAPP